MLYSPFGYTPTDSKKTLKRYAKNIYLCSKKMIMDGVRIINYSNIFLSCFMDDASSHSNMVKEHYMGYVYAGEIAINENGAITKLHRGDRRISSPG